MSELEIFSEAWAERLAEELNADEAYRESAAQWTGVLGLALKVSESDRRIAILELDGGRCKGTSTDPAACRPDYVIEAKEDTWEKVLSGELEPMWGLMSGKLKLTEGNLGDLVPQAASAARIVKCAERIDARFPSGGTPRE